MSIGMNEDSPIKVAKDQHLSLMDIFLTKKNTFNKRKTLQFYCIFWHRIFGGQNSGPLINTLVSLFFKLQHLQHIGIRYLMVKQYYIFSEIIYPYYYLEITFLWSSVYVLVYRWVQPVKEIFTETWKLILVTGPRVRVQCEMLRGHRSSYIPSQTMTPNDRSQLIQECKPKPHKECELRELHDKQPNLKPYPIAKLLRGFTNLSLLLWHSISNMWSNL